MARGVRRSWVPTFCLTCCVPRDTIFLPLSDPQFPHLGGNVIKAHSVLQTGAVMCCGHTSVQPTVAKGKKTTREFWAVAQGLARRESRLLLAHQPSQHKTSAFV